MDPWKQRTETSVNPPRMHPTFHPLAAPPRIPRRSYPVNLSIATCDCNTLRIVVRTRSRCTTVRCSRCPARIKDIALEHAATRRYLNLLRIRSTQLRYPTNK